MGSLNQTFKMYSLKLLQLICITLSIRLSLTDDIDVGLPLRLTPYIQSGNTEEARKLSLVSQLTPNITSYSGFFTVDEECDSNMFFWYFPSQTTVEDHPITLWLQGGPGSSSLFGLFVENGPYELTLDGELKLREYSWNRESSILYIDNPVGSGYSFAKSVDCYSRNISQVAENLHSAMEQFFELFPELKKSKFFISGESYAGKYVPALAHRIQEGPTTIRNMEGMMIGNGFIDPAFQANYSKLYYELGLVDNKTRDEMAEIERQIQIAVANDNYTEAYILRDEKLLDEKFAQTAGFSYFYNFLYADKRKYPDYKGFVVKPEIRLAIHVGNASWDDDSTVVADALLDDYMRSALPYFIPVLDHYDTLLYYGQFDLRDPFGPSIEFINNMEWSGSNSMDDFKFHLWFNGEMAGYGKTGWYLTYVVIRNAGHMVPLDQPYWAWEMYNSFITGEFSKKKSKKIRESENVKLWKELKRQKLI